MAKSDSQIDKPQRGRPKRAELPDVNINTGAQSINTERASLTKAPSTKPTVSRIIKENQPLTGTFMYLIQPDSFLTRPRPNLKSNFSGAIHGTEVDVNFVS